MSGRAVRLLAALTLALVLATHGQAVHLPHVHPHLPHPRLHIPHHLPHFLQPQLPPWFHTPAWFRRLGHHLLRFMSHHEASGLFVIVFAEELGIPFPAPGDVAVAWAGYLVAIGQLSHALAYVCVVGGAVTGSFCLFTISGRLGQPFLRRYGRYVGLDDDRLARAERAFRRWGVWAIVIGRLIPGLRILISAFSGAFGIPTWIFVPAVAVSSTIWATVFLELGRALGPRTQLLVSLVPADLLPILVLLLLLLAGLYLAYEHAWRPRLLARRRAREKRATHRGQ
ncbi:MAG TPA: DedA family protein [Candidatus Dormibacteraeota bacterium]|nr:DedA family protein [Candidatus Dormibacteraeota bacterium]